MENAIFGFMGALIGAGLGFIGSLLSTFGKSKDTSKDVLTRTVTNERAQ
jgi:ABC-type antimicrobial peptide transport system permease subunit